MAAGLALDFAAINAFGSSHWAAPPPNIPSRAENGNWGVHLGLQAFIYSQGFGLQGLVIVDLLLDLLLIGQRGPCQKDFSCSAAAEHGSDATPCGTTGRSLALPMLD